MKNIVWALRSSFFLMLLVIANNVNAVGYYGFFHSSWQAVNILNTQQTQRVADFTNASWITDSSNADVISDMGISITNGQKSIIDLSFIFYQRTGSNVLTLKSNWQTNWNSFVSTLNAYGPSYKNNIAAFYPIDEPNGNNISIASIQTVTNAIRASFPSVPIAVIYSMSADPLSIQYYDWVGFDCYSNGQFNCNGTNYTINYAKMKNLLNATQRIMLIPQTGLPSGNFGCCVNNLTWENLRFYELAYGDSQVVGIFPYLWQNLGGWVGLNGIVQLQPTVMNIGQTVKSNWSYPAGIVPVYRFTSEYANTDHLFTLNEQEGINAAVAGQYSFEGFGFSIYSSQLPATHPLYRCRTSYATHFVSQEVSCEGFIQEGLLGYVSNYQTSATVPLYRFFNSANGSHLETVNYSEGTSAGLTYEGIQGYSPSISF